MKKLLEFQKKIGAIKKDKQNPHFKSNYATLPQILFEVKPILSELGLLLLQPTFGGKAVTRIIDIETNEEVVAEIDLPQGLNAQQLGSALTYYRRYLLAGLLSLELDDDDGRMASRPKKLPELIIGSDNFIKVKEALANGYTIEQVKAKYTLSKETEAAL